MHRHVSLVACLPAPLAPRFDQRQFICLSSRARFAFRQLLSRIDLQLLNITLYRFTQIGNQVVAVGDLNGGRCALPSSIRIQAGPISGESPQPLDANLTTRQSCRRISLEAGQLPVIAQRPAASSRNAASCATPNHPRSALALADGLLRGLVL